MSCCTAGARAIDGLKKEKKTDEEVREYYGYVALYRLEKEKRVSATARMAKLRVGHRSILYLI